MVDAKSPTEEEGSHQENGQRSFSLWEEVPTGIRKTKSNFVVTSRYTIFTFVPVNFFEQFFYTPVNLFFLSLAIMQTIPAITVTDGRPTQLLPVCFVTLVSAIKDAIEDYSRHKNDTLENSRKTRRVEQTTEVEVPEVTKELCWADVKVGDTIVLYSNDLVPADMVILATSDADNIAYIETANLDGETNLKVRSAPLQCAQLCDHAEPSSSETQAKDWYNLRGTLYTEEPNGSIYTFAGKLETESKVEIPIDPANLLLRGCKLKNTEWVIGKTIYTGHETKIEMNSSLKSDKKQSQVQRKMNQVFIVVLVWMAVVVIACATINVLFQGIEGSQMRYLNLFYSAQQSSGFVHLLVLWLTKAGTNMLLYLNFLPISLVVTVQTVKYIQSILVNKNERMIWKEKHAVSRTSDLMEELGQVSYVFSDKTGTLTQNLMEFRKCSIGGKLYGQGLTEIRRRVLAQEGKEIPDEPKPKPGSKVTSHVNFIDDYLETELQASESAEALFFLHLAINQTAVTRLEDGKIFYSSSSPDEEALVYGAQHFGYEFSTRRPGLLYVNLPCASSLEVEVLAVIEFTSSRKRSSMICKYKDPNTGEDVVRIFTKGADTMVAAILDPTNKDSPEFADTLKQMDEMAVDGLRTLMLAQRQIPNEEFEKWLPMYEEALTSLTEREEKIAKVADLIEKDLFFQGATGIEDRLQEGVSETIQMMRGAGIRIWMLTGDKIETAINIGIATGLLEACNLTERRPIFDWDDFEERALTSHKTTEDMLKDYVEQCLNSVREEPGCYEAIVTDGRCLELLLKHPDDFLMLTKDCASVLACRVSPSQKGDVVRLFKDRIGKVTAAIGDGANDCNMIQSAHVGIGIRGEEGLQAFSVSDYGIGQFRFLGELLLVHGRSYYRNVAGVVHYMFYKNFAVVLPQLFWGFTNYQSGTPIYQGMLFSFYNVFFTGLPVMLYGMFDKDVDLKATYKNPRLYQMGPQDKYLNKQTTMSMLANGLFHGTIVFLVPYFVLAHSVVNNQGRPHDYNFYGFCSFLFAVIVVNIRLFLLSYTTKKIYLFSFFISIFNIIFFYAIYSFGLDGWADREFLQTAVAEPGFWGALVVTVCICNSRDYMWRVVKSEFFPEIVDEVRIGERMARKATLAKGSSIVSEQAGETSQVMPRINMPGRLASSYTFTAADPREVSAVRRGIAKLIPHRRHGSPLVKLAETA